MFTRSHSLVIDESSSGDRTITTVELTVLAYKQNLFKAEDWRHVQRFLQFTGMISTLQDDVFDALVVVFIDSNWR